MRLSIVVDVAGLTLLQVGPFIGMRKLNRVSGVGLAVAEPARGRERRRGDEAGL